MGKLLLSTSFIIGLALTSMMEASKANGASTPDKAIRIQDQCPQKDNDAKPAYRWDQETHRWLFVGYEC